MCSKEFESISAGRKVCKIENFTFPFSDADEDMRFKSHDYVADMETSRFLNEHFCSRSNFDYIRQNFVTLNV